MRVFCVCACVISIVSLLVCAYVFCAYACVRVLCVRVMCVICVSNIAATAITFYKLLGVSYACVKADVVIDVRVCFVR